MKTRILHGDCLAVLPTLQDKSIQCCVTSPPYYNLRNYSTGAWIGGDPVCEHVSESGKCRCGAEWIDQQIGLEATPAEYVANLVQVFREIRRVLRDDGIVFLNIGDSYSAGGRCGGTPKQETNKAACLGRKPTAKQLLMIPARVGLALQDDGWILRSDIIWQKANPMPESVRDRPTSAHEHVFLLAKQERYYYDQDAIREPVKYVGKVGFAAQFFRDSHKERDKRGYYEADGLKGANSRNVWTINPKGFKGAHFATMPIQLAERCILAGTSAHGCCSACGAPWRRQTEVARPSSWEDRKAAGHASGRGGNVRLQRQAGATHDFDNSAGGFGAPKIELTIGWQPSCSCEADVVPCTVLDPFGGAGTTAAAATKHGRDAVLIELNEDYIALAKQRLVIVV